MKKLFFGIALCCTVMVSCNKERTCKCSTKINGEDQAESTVISNEKCKDLNTSETLNDNTVETICVEE